MYLKQKGFKISGSKPVFSDRAFTHTRGNLSASDAVEDEEFLNSREDNSDSDDSSNDSSYVRQRVIGSDVCTRGRTRWEETFF